MLGSARVVAALALVSLAPLDAMAKWTQLRSENFLFIGDAPERDIRATAQKLEQFREVMLRALPGTTMTSPVPTVVIVFGSDTSFTPYKPKFQGRTVDAAGLFIRNEDVNYGQASTHIGGQCPARRRRAAECGCSECSGGIRVRTRRPSAVGSSPASGWFRGNTRARHLPIGRMPERGNRADYRPRWTNPSARGAEVRGRGVHLTSAERPKRRAVRGPAARSAGARDVPIR